MTDPGRPSASPPTSAYGEGLEWRPQRPRLEPFALLLAWAVASVSLLVAAAVVPGVSIPSAEGAVITAALIAILNAVFPPVLAALRLPFTLVTGFISVLVLDAVMLKAASDLRSQAIHVNSFTAALFTALVAAAAAVVLSVLLGTNHDDTHTIRIVQRVARRQGEVSRTDAPGLIFLEIDGLALPVLQRAMRDGNAPELARWLEEGTHRLVEWETDFSSQTGASQAGILLGSNDDIPAFRWVEKESGRVMTCSAPPDCAEIERRHAGNGLLVDGGASRGNLLSGEADEVILTVSRMDEEKRANTGYRAFFANGSNVTRVLVLFVWELILEWSAALRAIRRDVRPRGHRGGIYPLIRGGICVVVRDLIVFGVLTDMMRGRPAVYATFSSYDEVAHHSGLERADTLEALRKLDQQFGRLARARRYAPRPYELVVLSDHGQTQGATFKQRNGYGLADLVNGAIERAQVAPMGEGDEHDTAVGQAVREATGRAAAKPEQHQSKNDVSGRDVVVLGSGNLGLVYLMGVDRRMTLEEIEERHPRLITALREHPHVGFLLVRSAAHGPVALGAGGANYLVEDRVEGDDPLAPFSPNAAEHLRRTDTFTHVADIMVNSFYDAGLDQGCAFEELISFHGGMGGPQTRAFLLAPVELPLPDEPIVGAHNVHKLLLGWRRLLAAEPPAQAAVAPPVPDPL